LLLYCFIPLGGQLSKPGLQVGDDRLGINGRVVKLVSQSADILRAVRAFDHTLIRRPRKNLLGGPYLEGPKAAVGASYPLPRTQANVSSPNRHRPFGPGCGERVFMPLSGPSVLA